MAFGSIALLLRDGAAGVRRGRLNLLGRRRGLCVGMMFDTTAFDLGAREDFFLTGFQQLILGSAEAALRQA